MTISDNVIAILDNLSDKFGKAIDWTQANVLPYAKELTEKIVRYEFVTSCVWIGIFIFIFLIPSILFYYLENKIYKKSSHDEGFGICIGTVLLVIYFIATCIQIFDIVKCVTFPEKVIFEAIKSMTQ